MNTTWTQFKTIADTRILDILMLSDDGTYHLFASEPGISMRCNIDRNPTDATDLDEFEADYLSKCNPVRKDHDASGRPLARKAIATAGFAMQWLSFNLIAGKYDSLECYHADNTTPVAGFTYKIKDANGDIITSAANEADAVKTVIIYQPQYDIELIGARFRQREVPTTEIHAYMEINPEENIGSEFEMVLGGHDLRFFEERAPVGVDGRAPKLMVHDPVYNTNMMEWYFYHPTGTSHDIMIELEYYRS